MARDRRRSAARDNRRRAAAARRRRQARDTPPVASPGRSRRTLLAGAAVAALLVVGLVVVVVWSQSRGDGDADLGTSLRSPLVSEEGALVPVEEVPGSYRVVYRLESMEPQGVAVRTEEIRVRRPFDGRVVSAVGDQTAAARELADPELDVRSTSMGRYADATAGAGSSATVAVGLPSTALGDLRFDGVLDDLVRIGLFEPRERREVLGRDCQVYRTGQALETLVLTMPTADDHADACIDASGILLEQIVVVDGSGQVHEIATELEIDVELGDEVFAIDGEPVPVVDGGSSLDPLDPAVAPVEGYWAFATPPSGYEHVGRFRLRSAVASQEPVATSTTIGVTPIDAVESFVDVYADGVSLLVLQQGPADAAPRRDAEHTTDVDAGALGPASVSASLTGSALTVTTDDGFVELVGTRSAADLAALAATLVAS